MIKDENDFLGIMIDCKNDDNTCSIGKVIKESGMTDIECLPFFRSLRENKIIQEIDLETYKINPIAFSIYQSPVKKVGKSVYDSAKFSLKHFIRIIVEIIVALIIAYLVYHFGWQ